MAIRTINILETSIHWIDLQNPSLEEREQIATQYELDLYALSDSVEPNHLPKFEEQANMNFFIVRLRINPPKKKVNIQHISSKIAVFYNDETLITIHKGEMPLIDDIISKFIDTAVLKTTTSILVKILHKVLLSYEEPLMKLSDEISKFQGDILLKDIPPHTLQRLFYLKNRANLSRKILILTDDVLDSLQVKKAEKSSLRDIRDLHTKLIVLYDQVLDEINSLQSIYISVSAQKTNEVMKTLTIFSVFFLPLTFIVGVYGMNFKHMPELYYKWSYPICLGVMLMICIGLYIWFKRKKWL